MEFLPTTIPDVIVIQPKVFGDERGFFMETYQSQRFAAAGIPTNFVQDNHSRSRQGTLRGLHYQTKQTQGKLFRVIVGEVYDVAVDIRRSSPTYGKWFGVVLSAENKKQVWVPAGFAHGFYVMSEFAEVTYKTTDFYAPQWERSILWSDPALGITWPIPVGQAPLLSSKDEQGKLLADAEVFD
jgi:dTDP-4-dehydrorhamnose 3,5-epimerase